MEKTINKTNGTTTNGSTKTAKSKTSKATSAKATSSKSKAVEKKQTAPKVEKPKFDAKAFADSVAKAFGSNKNVDIVADSALKAGPRDANQPEFSYIHFFRKGTEKDMFKMYTNSRGTRFAVSRAVYATGKFKDAKPIQKKNKKGESVVVYANICVPTVDAVATAKSIIEAYMAI